MNKTYINCKYRDEIIVPLIGISPNVYEWSLISDKDKVGTLCLMKDGILAEVKGCETKTVFEFEEDIKRLYNVEPYEFMKRWYNASEKQMSCITLCHIYLSQHNREE